MNKLIYGIDGTEGVTAVEVENGEMILFYNDGRVEKRPTHYWFLSSKWASESKELEGRLHYKYMNMYDDYDMYRKRKADAYKAKVDIQNIANLSEQAMIYNGVTLFKGLKVKDVSVLSFDIEANGLLGKEGIPIAKDPTVYLITNTFRSITGEITKRMFCLDEYEDVHAMIDDWCSWVNEINPSVVCGHNIFGYDLPYLNFVNGTPIDLGVGKRPLVINKYASNFRKDGSQSYEYYDMKCYGRQLIDTMFLAIKFDFARNYVSYGLKQIIKQEGLEKEDRQHYDASQIAKNWHIPEEKEKIKAYAIDDGDDALALYDLMIPSFFYYTQSVPMQFQHINNTATGRQINSFLIRSYIQEGHSIPKGDQAMPFQGAISFGNPGVYKNCLKWDIASLYPSIIRTFKVYDRKKDPKGNFLKMVDYFTEERLINKKKGNDTSDRYYKELEQSQKVFINSSFGLMGAPGLNFNSPHNAAFITEKGRDILQTAIKWATGKELKQVPKTTKTGKIETKEDGSPKLTWSFDD